MSAGEPVPSSVRISGLITMEDVIEALIDEPITDEFDSAQHDQHQNESKSEGVPSCAVGIESYSL